MSLGANAGIGGAGSTAPYSVGPDGRFLLVVASDDVTRAPVTIMQNWEAALGR